MVNVSVRTTPISLPDWQISDITQQDVRHCRKKERKKERKSLAPSLHEIFEEILLLMNEVLKYSSGAAADN